MMTFTIVLPELDEVLAECAITPVSRDDENGITVLTVHHRQAISLVEAIQRAGGRIWARTPRGLTSDPTFALAAQHLELRERT